MDASTSRLTLQNETASIAQFVVRRGDATIARLPGLAPGAVQRIPTTQAYTVVATTILEGNTYTSAPIVFTGAMRFLAQVVQHQAQGTHAFDVVTMPSTDLHQLQFQNTSIGPVTLQLSQDGAPLQTVVVDNSFASATLQIGDTCSIHAAINGITTATVTTDNPDAVLAAVEEASGFFTIAVR